MNNNNYAILVLEPKEPQPGSVISIIGAGDFEALTLHHSNYRRLYEPVDEVLNIYMWSDFKHPHRDLSWILKTDPLRYEHLHEALRPSFLRQEHSGEAPDPVALGLY